MERTEKIDFTKTLSASETVAGLAFAVLLLLGVSFVTSGGLTSVFSNSGVLASVFSGKQGLDAEIYNCELHRLSNCSWGQEPGLDNYLTCDFTNTSKVTIHTSKMLAWSYSNNGVKLDYAPIGFDTLTPGQTSRVDMRFHEETDVGYVCSMDPGTELAKNVLADHMIPVAID
ncbi:MAG: hypothetical protein WD672_06200 [Woeseia sp.]